VQIRADARLPFPRPAVFAAYRDEIVSVLPYLPNVRRIEIVSKTTEGDVTKFVNEWHGGGEIPAAARAFVSESMLSWTDRATWDARAFTCTWTIETHAFTEAIECRGTNTFFEDGDGTRIEMRGDITIDPKKLRGVPGLLSGKIAKTAEELLVGRIAPNFVETSRGLSK
jgi:hypothetical protein